MESLYEKTFLPPLLTEGGLGSIDVYHSDAATEGNHFTEKVNFENIPFNIPDIDEDMAWFIGVLISSQRLFGDDYKNITIVIDYNKDIIEKIKTQIKRFWDFDIFVYVNKKNLACIYTINAIYLAQYFNKHIFIPIQNEYKLPKFITQSNNDIKKAFIKGIFDGYKKDTAPDIHPSLTVQIHNICLSLGINTKIINNKVVQV